MTAVRDTLCNLRPLEIPRPHVPGLQFIPTRGRQGFYKSIRRDGAQFGLQIKPMGPRRPALADACWTMKEAVKEEEQETSPARQTPVNLRQNVRNQQRNSLNSSDDDSRRSSQLSNYSDVSSKRSVGEEPNVPEPDYDSSSSPKPTYLTIESPDPKKMPSGRANVKFGGVSKF